MKQNYYNYMIIFFAGPVIAKPLSTYEWRV